MKRELIRYIIVATLTDFHLSIRAVSENYFNIKNVNDSIYYYILIISCSITRHLASIPKLF